MLEDSKSKDLTLADPSLRLFGLTRGVAGGCAAGVVLGWGIGIGVEAMFPSLMLAGGEAQLWCWCKRLNFW